MKTGGPNWQRQNLQPSTVSSMQQSKGAADWSSGMQAGHFPVNPMQSQPPVMMGGGGMMPPPMVGQPPMMMGGQPGMMMGSQPMGMQQQPFMVRGV